MWQFQVTIICFSFTLESIWLLIQNLHDSVIASAEESGCERLSTKLGNHGFPCKMLRGKYHPRRVLTGSRFLTKEENYLI